MKWVGEKRTKSSKINDNKFLQLNTYIGKVGIQTRHYVHVRLRHKTSLILRQVQEIPHTLLKVIHLRNPLRIIRLAHRMVLLEVEELAEKLARPHVASIDQLLHIIIQNNSSLLDGLEIADLKEGLARQLGNIRIKVPNLLVQRVEFRVALLEEPAFVVLREANNNLVENYITLTAIDLLFLEGGDFDHHSLDVVNELALLHFGFRLLLVVVVGCVYLLNW